ncbi:MAG: PCRF domain-containing protein [Nitratireductor sp.]
MFAGDLFRMYERYAAERKWKVEVLSESEGEVGGYKEVIAAINGRGVFKQAEMSRACTGCSVPETEAGGPYPYIGGY